MTRLSVLVPFVGRTEEFEDSLASVLRHRPDQCEIVVVHDGTYDDPHQLGHEVTWVEVPGRRRLIRMFNAGVASSAGEFVVLVRPGVELDENWQESVLDTFAAHDQVGSVTPLLLKSDNESKILASGIDTNSRFTRRLVGNRTRNAPRSLGRLRPAGPTTWLAAYRRNLLELVGAVDDELDDVFLDAELSLSLQQIGFRTKLVEEFVGYVENDKDLLAESEKPHGRSSQRAFARHTRTTAAANAVSCVLLDVLSAVTQPWRLSHAIQRVGATRWADEDRQFSIRLKQIQMMRSWENDAQSKPLRTVVRRAA